LARTPCSYEQQQRKGSKKKGKKGGSGVESVFPNGKKEARCKHMGVH